GYLALYPSLMNTNFSQIGNFLLLFTMAGYYFYLRNYDYWAGFFWGILIAIKLFPALLVIFAFVHRRYKIVIIMTGTALLSFFLPLLTHNSELFELYFKTLNKVIWYGNSWNASIYGYVFRLLIEEGSSQNLGLIRGIYCLLFA